MFREKKKSISYEEPFKMKNVVIRSVQEYGEHGELRGKRQSMREAIVFKNKVVGFFYFIL